MDKQITCRNCKHLSVWHEDEPCKSCCEVSNSFSKFEPVIDERQKYDEKFTNKTAEMYMLARGNKTNDYGETWKRLGLLGLYVKIFIKEGRLNSLIWGNKEPTVKGESIKDTLLDMANYCVYAAIALEEENITGEQERIKHELEMYNELKARLQIREDGEND